MKKCCVIIREDEAKEVFGKDELEELAEVRAEGEEKIVFSKNVLGELRYFCVFSELIKVCVDGVLFVL